MITSNYFFAEILVFMQTVNSDRGVLPLVLLQTRHYITAVLA